MLIENRYFVVNVPNPNMTQVYEIIVGEAETQRTSLDGTKMIVKLPLGDDSNHAVLNAATEYDHAGILQYIKDNLSEWQEEII